MIKLDSVRKSYKGKLRSLKIINTVFDMESKIINLGNGNKPVVIF